MTPILKTALAWLLARAAEKSTWVGIVTMIPALVPHASVIEQGAALIASIALVVVQEPKPLTAAVVVQDAASTIEAAIANAVGS